MRKILILGISLLLIGNRSLACELSEYREESVRAISVTVDNICSITECIANQSPQTRLVTKKLLGLRDYSKDISMAFEAMDVCVAAGGVLSEKLEKIKTLVENWRDENFSKDSTALLSKALDDFETVYFGNWSDSEEPLLDTRLFSSIHRRMAKEQLKDLRDARAIEIEIKKSEIVAKADMAEAQKRMIEAQTKTDEVIALSTLTIQKNLIDLTRNIEKDKLAIEEIKQKREFLPYEADLKVIKDCYELAEKHMGLLKLKTELDRAETEVEQKRADVLKAHAEAERAAAEAEKLKAEARYAEIQQEIARQKSEIDVATSLLSFGKTMSETFDLFKGDKK